MTKQVKIFFKDLTEKKKRELVRAYGITDPDEMLSLLLGWEVVPIDTIEVE
ncbi:MAG: hypothetical protein QXU98_03565 [Candidatus Parvarchaeota archaeon]